MYEKLKFHTSAPMKTISCKFHGWIFNMNMKWNLYGKRAVYKMVKDHI